MTALPVASTTCSQAALDQFSFEVVCNGTAPAAMEDDVAPDRLEVGRRKRRTVIEAEGERNFRKGLVLLQVHVRLEDPGEDGEVRKGSPGRDETVVDVLHRDNEGLVRTSPQENLSGFVPVGVGEVHGRGILEVDFQGSLGSKNDVVVVTTFADQQDFRRLQSSVAIGIECVWRDTGGHSAAGSVEESCELTGSLCSARPGRDEGLRWIGEQEVTDGVEVCGVGMVDNGLEGGFCVCHVLGVFSIYSKHIVFFQAKSEKRITSSGRV